MHWCGIYGDTRCYKSLSDNNVTSAMKWLVFEYFHAKCHRIHPNTLQMSKLAFDTNILTFPHISCFFLTWMFSFKFDTYSPYRSIPRSQLQRWKNKWGHFDLKVESLAELKFDPEFRVIWEYLSQIHSILKVNSKIYFSNPGSNFSSVVTQLFRSKSLHFSFQWSQSLALIQVDVLHFLWQLNYLIPCSFMF